MPCSQLTKKPGGGYWLFLRNGIMAYGGEGVLTLAGEIEMLKGDEHYHYYLNKSRGPRAIYRWIPYHRS